MQDRLLEAFLIDHDDAVRIGRVCIQVNGHRREHKAAVGIRNLGFHNATVIVPPFSRDDVALGIGFLSGGRNYPDVALDERRGRGCTGDADEGCEKRNRTRFGFHWLTPGSTLCWHFILTPFL